MLTYILGNITMLPIVIITIIEIKKSNKKS